MFCTQSSSFIKGCTCQISLKKIQCLSCFTFTTLVAFLDFHQPQKVAIQETKIDSTNDINCGIVPRNVSIQYVQEGHLNGEVVILLIHKHYASCAHHGF